ncbi:MAG: SPOR domain-containing protein [Bacteroidota bacterium]
MCTKLPSVVSSFLLILLGLIPFLGFSQPGKLTIFQDNRVNELIEKHIALNKRQEGVIDGYRIQIFFDSGAESKKRAMETKKDFQDKYTDIPSYLSFSEPFFKIRVGDFRRKVEADGLLHKINLIYPNAYIVRDKISYPKIN